MLRSHNDKAVIITTPWDELDGSDMRRAMEETVSFEEELLKEAGLCPECHHHHHEDEHECHHHHHEDEHECHHHHHEDEHECHHHHDHEGHHHADEIFDSIGFETPHKFSEDELDAILKRIDSSEGIGVILRAKGIVASTDGKWIHFDYVPGEYEIRRGSADVTGRLCVIGSGLDREKLKEIFGI